MCPHTWLSLSDDLVFHYDGYILITFIYTRYLLSVPSLNGKLVFFEAVVRGVTHRRDAVSTRDSEEGLIC